MNIRTGVTCLDAVGDKNGRTQVLAWEGRLDNRNDLLLRFKDSLRRDTSNEALALAVYERWGTSGFVHLIGDWSLVISDAVNRRVVLASDFAGVRPLYYHLGSKKLLWSTRLQPLVEATGTDELDEKYVSGFLTFGGCPNRTPYNEIYSVPPGHALSVSAKETTVSRFWSLPTGDVTRYRNEHRYEEQLRALFHEAVAVRLQTDAPVLTELSGGFDSSSVACMASHLIQVGSVGAPRLVGVSYVWRDSCDEPFIRNIEESCGIEGIHLSTHDNPLITNTQVGNSMPEGFEPLHTSVSTAARGLSAKVFLTGRNGDLAMGNWFDDSMQVAASIRRLRITRAYKEALAWSKLLRIPISWILWRAFRAAVPLTGGSATYMLTDGSYMLNSTETSLPPGFRKRTGLSEKEGSFSKSWMCAPPERRKHFQALTMMLELRLLQPPELLQHLDYTHPFAHRPLVEFLMTIPAEVLCGAGEPRRLMRRALSDLWPGKLRSRRSKGFFNAPWLEALRPMARDLLKKRQIEVVERGFVDRTSFLSRLERLSAGLDCNVTQLRQIIVLEFWLRQRGLRRLFEGDLQAA